MFDDCLLSLHVPVSARPRPAHNGLLGASQGAQDCEGVKVYCDLVNYVCPGPRAQGAPRGPRGPHVAPPVPTGPHGAPRAPWGAPWGPMGPLQPPIPNSPESMGHVCGTASIYPRRRAHNEFLLFLRMCLPLHPDRKNRPSLNYGRYTCKVVP